MTSSHKRTLVWFREDLRISDHSALFYASQAATEGVIGLYILDPHFQLRIKTAACRVDFTLRGLVHLREQLKKLNIPLLIVSVAHTDDIGLEILSIMKKHAASALYFNKQYEIYEKNRDQAVTNLLHQHQLSVFTFDDCVILPPGSILNLQGQPFSVFTAYKRTFQKRLQVAPIKLLPPPAPQNPLSIVSSEVPTTLSGFHSTVDPTLWPAGELAAKQKLEYFVEHHLLHYDKTRDFPARNCTSQLSPYLASGMISPRVCFQTAFLMNHAEYGTGNSGALCWMGELIWRDFYKHILVATPRISKHKAFQVKTDSIAWQSDPALLTAWETGQTGFPIIDAAMRQLNQTGWMHNRLRMIVAMFFSKNLFLNWRLGEAYFMNHLIDGDLAANNGGWQWCASTGTDAAPYFRVFSPIKQSERFDPDGDFIYHYCPELKNVPPKFLHDPTRLPNNLAYPKPIIDDLAATRRQAIAAFAELSLSPHK